MNHEYEFEMQNALDDLPFRHHVTAIMRITYQVEAGYRGSFDEESHAPNIDFLKVECIDAELHSRDGSRSMNIFSDLSADDFAEINERFERLHKDSDAMYEKLLDHAGVEA